MLPVNTLFLKGISKAKQLENITQCLESAKDFVSEHNKHQVFNKVIKKRKKAKTVDTNLENFGKDLLNALNIVHIAILSATQSECECTTISFVSLTHHSL